MPTMWDRLRPHKDGLAASPGDRRKQNNSEQQNWQNPRSTSPYGYSFTIKGGPAPPRPPREFEYSTSPPEQPHTSAPAVQALRYPPQAGHDSYRNSAYDRPVSSVYSQPSPAAATFAAQQLRHEVYSDPNEISPPSSPDELSPRDGPYSYTGVDVSPIEESNNRLFIMNQPENNQPAEQSRSNIPMMRRERRKNSAAAFQASREMNSQAKQPRPHGSDVRWDPRTGEPTVGEKGKPSQVNPHQYVQGLSAGKAPIGAPKQAGQQPISPFGVRLKPITQKASSPKAEPAPKPEWRGGSGRTTLVEPVADDKNATPLNIPRKSSKRTPRGPGVLSPVSSVGSETASPPPERVAPVKFDNSMSQPSTTRNATPSTLQVSTEKTSGSDAQSYPSPPLSDDRAVPAKTPEQPRSQQHIPTPSSQSPISQTLFPPADKSIRRKPAGGAGHNPHVSTSSSVYSHQEVHQAPAPPVDDWVQPPSRFSVTTYATSAHTESPRPSVDDLPPMPTPPRQFTESPKSMPGGSILDRKRPVVGGYESTSHSQSSPPPIRINMELSSYKTTASKNRPTGSRPVPPGNHSVLSVTSASSGDKTLPLAPPELSARDRVAVLNAQVEALGNRRININHAIKQMTELMPIDNVLASEAVIQKRENEKRKVETLRAELADVQREEYELGLKLHRAYKRIDREAEFEPTTLWVRRITGRE